MTDALTPWYPPHIKPVRVGVYETDSEINHFPGAEGCYQHWDGQVWGYCAHRIDYCLTADIAQSRHQSPRWRGLKSPA